MITETHINHALRRLAPGGIWTLRNSAIVEWRTPEVPQPAWSDIEAEARKIEIEMDGARLRRNALVNAGLTRDEKIDALWQALAFDNVEMLNDLRSKQMAIDEKYPPPAGG